MHSCWISCPADTQTVAYRGKEFAAQNAFCNAGDTSYPNSKCSASLPKNVSQSVAINTLTSWNGVNGNFVQAIVSQTQPAYLSAILGLTTVTVGGQAIVQVKALAKPPCALALTGSISFQGSPNINAPGCDMASNDPANNALNFTGGGMSLGTPPVSLSAAGGCTGAATFCSTALTYTSPVTNPFSGLDGDLTTLCGANPTNYPDARCGLSTCPTASGLLVPYTATNKCTNDGFTLKGNTPDPLAAGVYFISGVLTLKGGSSITGTGVTFILLPGATIDTKGGGTLTLTAPTTAPGTSSLPTAVQSDASLLNGHGHLHSPSPLSKRTDVCAIRWNEQHQPCRKHVCADGVSDVPGQPRTQSWAAASVAVLSPIRSRLMATQLSTIAGARRRASRCRARNMCS